MTVLVIGGGGYIGSHMVKRMLEEDEQVIILDDFSKGYIDAIIGGTVERGNYGSEIILDALFKKYNIDSVMLFASFIEVGESVKDPALYYSNNLINCLTLLSVMIKYNVKQLVFSSSAAIYGAHLEKISEDYPCQPLSPYGKSKWMVEQVLADYARAYDFRSCSLRYFNAAGADPAGRLGERHQPETHLIPLVLKAASGRLPDIKIYGDDYNTPDGTCIRDYVHIQDLCDAHLAALNYLRRGGYTTAYNLGNARGYSVNEVITSAREVTGRSIKAVSAGRRPGDCPHLVANSQKISNELNWQPRFSDLHTMIEHAWKWELQHGKIW